MASVFVMLVQKSRTYQYPLKSSIDLRLRHTSKDASKLVPGLKLGKGFKLGQDFKLGID